MGSCITFTSADDNYGDRKIHIKMWAFSGSKRRKRMISRPRELTGFGLRPYHQSCSVLAFREMSPRHRGGIHIAQASAAAAILIAMPAASSNYLGCPDRDDADLGSAINFVAGLSNVGECSSLRRRKARRRRRGDRRHATSRRGWFVRVVSVGFHHLAPQTIRMSPRRS